MAQPTNVVRLFFESVDRFPDHTALVQKHRHITYKELAGEVLQTAAYFMREGIQKGDYVLVLIPMNVSLFRTILALQYLGATPVCIDQRYNPSHINACLQSLSCQAMIGTNRARATAWILSSHLRKIPIRLGTSFPLIPAYPAMSELAPADIALITCTQQHQSPIRLIQRNHGFLLEQLRTLKAEIRPSAEDVSLPAFPIVVLMNLAMGATSILPSFNPNQPEAFKANRLYEQLLKHHVKRFSASTYVVRKVAEFMIHHNLKLPALKEVFTGGAPVFPEEALIYHTAFGEASVSIMYGITDAEPISSISAENLASRIDRKLDEGLCVGMPAREVEIKIIQIHPNQRDSIQIQQKPATQSCVHGEIGEILVRGPHILHKEEQTQVEEQFNQIMFEDQIWRRTGDAGYLGKDGMLYVTGRCQTIIKREERYFAPFLYENFFEQIEGVASGTILEADQGMLAIIELKEKSQRDRIRRRLEHIELPYDRLVFLHKIPKKAKKDSQIDYAALRELLN